jgi:hypothetical protein
LLSGEFGSGDIVLVDIEDEQVVFKKKEMVDLPKLDQAEVSG